MHKFPNYNNVKSKIVFYSKTENDTVNVWAKIINEYGYTIELTELSKNKEYESINSWKDFDELKKYPLSEFANEAFHYYYMPILFKFVKFQSNYNINTIQFEGKHPNFDYAIGYFKQKGLRVFAQKNLKSTKAWMFGNFIFFYLLSQIISLITIIYKATIIKRQNDYYTNYDCKEFALIHSHSSFKNINKIKKELVFYYDDINLKSKPCKNSVSFYSRISTSDYIIILLSSIREVHKKIMGIYQDSSSFLGYQVMVEYLKFFSKRIGHFLLIDKAYQNIFYGHQARDFYSGEKESRYGILAMKYSKIYKNKAIAIPHGLAYSYNYPLGIFGDEYFATSNYEKVFLSIQYPNIDFHYNAQTANCIYSLNLNRKPSYDIVYFTEPRRPEVNHFIIEKLRNEINLSIKIHPLEEIKNYIKYNNVSIIDDFETAINSNICIARKSTILLEALHNNSISVAIINDLQDKFDYENLFPSLINTQIQRAYSINELLETLKKYV